VVDVQFRPEEVLSTSFGSSTVGSSGSSTVGSSGSSMVGSVLVHLVQFWFIWFIDGRFSFGRQKLMQRLVKQRTWGKEGEEWGKKGIFFFF
jgi:hypothetical protein